MAVHGEFRDEVVSERKVGAAALFLKVYITIRIWWLVVIFPSPQHEDVALISFVFAIVISP